MATTPSTATTEVYGVATTAENITIESLTKTPSPVSEPVPDQKNATAKEIYVDTRIDLKLTYRGTKIAETAGTVGGENTTITFDGVKYYVDSHEEAGTYNGLKRYNLSAHRFDNSPAAAAQQNQQNNTPQESCRRRILRRLWPRCCLQEAR